MKNHQVRHETLPSKAGMIANAYCAQFYKVAFFRDSEVDLYPRWIIEAEATLSTLVCLEYSPNDLNRLEQMACDMAAIVAKQLPKDACTFALGHGLTSIDNGIVTCRWAVFCGHVEFMIYTLSMVGEHFYLTVEMSGDLR